METQETRNEITLVLGGTGKTGRRVADQLRAIGQGVRTGSRSAVPAFDWDREETWEAAISGVSSIYITYSPDLAMPGAADAITALVRHARLANVKRLVLLSGRGEAEAQACEQIVMNAGLDWTIVRASWFNQNFSEGAFVNMVESGVIALPAGDTPEPFVDVDDIVDVAVAALTERGHAGAVYEVTGPRLMTFADVANALSHATDNSISYVDVPHDAFVDNVRQSGAPDDVVWMLDYLFATVLDGRNAHVTDGVERALGRPAKDFADYARDAVTDGCWRPQ